MAKQEMPVPRVAVVVGARVGLRLSAVLLAAQAGACGSNGSTGVTNTVSGNTYLGAVGGDAGASVVTNGNTLTWVSGGNAPNVLGPIMP